MISIITSIHNQLAMNQLFMERLRATTSVPYELIIIDNNSTDGSREFFQANADVVITNESNYSYPYCQNQGIDVAKYEYLTFLNNDIILSKDWDKRIIDVMNKRGIEVISFATNDHLENKQVQKKVHRKWKRIKYPIRAIFGVGYNALSWMLKLMYGNFDKYCEKRFEQFGDAVIEGFSGSCILIKKSALPKIGKWDERIQSADFDLFFRTKVRSLEHKDIQPLQLALGVYIHHYQRLTLRSKKLPSFTDKGNLISLKEKWGDKEKTLYKDVVG
jgi:GT2 family glycosyltransferase